MTVEALLYSDMQNRCRSMCKPFFDFIHQEDEPSQEFTPGTIEYQKRFVSPDSAEEYNTGCWKRRGWMARREKRIVRELLSGHAGADAVLDLPCGGGRLSSVIGEFTGTIIEMDIAAGQLLYGQRVSRCRAKQIWVKASAFDIPLEDNSVDGTVCMRLSHHLYTLKEKELLLAELLRVTRRFVVFYFVDSNSPKYLSRRIRKQFADLQYDHNSMTFSELSGLSEKFGGRIVKCASAAPFTPHRYALIEKRPAA